MSDRTPCICGFYDRYRPHNKVGGGQCKGFIDASGDADLLARIIELESLLSDARAEIAGLQKQLEQTGP